MDKIDMVAALIERIKMEERKKKDYEEAKKEAFRIAEKTDRRYWDCLNWNESNPSNEKIKDACKMARMLLLEISKESKPI